MTLELNIFNIAKQPRKRDELKEVNYIESLAHDYLSLVLYGDSFETCMFDSMISKLDYYPEEDSLNLARELEAILVHVVGPWMPTFEELATRSKKPL